MANGEQTPVDDRHLRKLGAIYMSVFAFVWAVGPPPVAGTTRVVVLVTALTLTAATLVLGFRAGGDGTRALDADWRRRYNRVGLVEFGSIAVVVIALLLLGRPDLIAPLACLVVGLHFLPLATLFRQHAYRWTGIALTAVGILGVVVALTSGGAPARTAVGFGAAATLWLTSAAVALGGKKTRADANPADESMKAT